MTNYPVCPVCGAEAQTFYRDSLGTVFGCDECVKAVDWLELAEEQGRYSEDRASEIDVVRLLEAKAGIA